MLPILLALIACDVAPDTEGTTGVDAGPASALQSESAACPSDSVVEFDVGVGAMVQLWTCPDETFCYPLSEPLYDIDSETGILTAMCPGGVDAIEARWIGA